MQLKLHNTIQGPVSQKSPKTFRTRKAIHRTPTHLSCEAGLFICCKGNKNLNHCKVSCLETPLFWRYCVTRKASEKLRDFQETGSRFLKWYCDENHIFPIEPILKHKQVACMTRKMLFTIFKYLFSFQRYLSFSNMQISQLMTSYTQPNFDQI